MQIDYMPSNIKFFSFSDSNISLLISYEFFGFLNLNAFKDVDFVKKKLYEMRDVAKISTSVAFDRSKDSVRFTARQR
jgi:hypothetical protein